jgi:small-conductance mechanosensitive channel
MKGGFRMIDGIIQYILTNSKTFGSAATIVIFGILFYFLLRKAVVVLGKKGALAQSAVRVIRIYLRWVFAVVVTMLMLQELGVLKNVWSAFLAIAAMIAVAFFAVWSVLSNALCTLLILIYKPFSIGDRISLPTDNVSGRVEDINLMFTTLVDDEKKFVQIPNNQFFQKAICRERGA